MDRVHLIGIAGKARAGKDTLANAIIAQYGGYRYGFADPVKAMVKVLGIDMAQPYWEARKEDVVPALSVSPRRLMQTLGTEWGRQLINPDIWLIMAKQRLVSEGPGMVIPDIRFENEAKWVRDQGGLVIHIVRDAAPVVEEHASEAGVAINAEHDEFYANNGSLEDLRSYVLSLTSGDQT